MMKHLIYLFSFMIIGMLACETPQIEPITQDDFFDLDNYFKKERERLQDQVELDKTVIYDGKEEHLLLQNPNFSKELNIFQAANINKTSLLDKYKVDSIINDSHVLERVKYTALDESLRSKEIEIFYGENEIDSIFIYQSSESIITHFTQKMWYAKDIGYRIINQQDITSLTPHTLIVDAKFVY